MAYTSSLVQVYTDISGMCQAITDTNLFPSTGIQPGGVPSQFGAEYLMANINAPAWTWVPISEKWGPPVSGGPMGPDTSNYLGPLPSGDTPGNNVAPTPIVSRESHIDVWCWGADGTSSTDPLLPYSNAEQLMVILVQQAYQYASPMSVLFDGGRFEQRKEFARAGRAYVASMVFRFPVVQQPDIRAIVSSYPLTANPDPFLEEA